MRVKYLAKIHNAMSAARAEIQTPRSLDDCTTHEATVPAISLMVINLRYMLEKFIDS